MTDILEQAKSKFESTKDNWSSVYQKARDDLKFISDDDYAQWNGWGK